ncbi:hypothetical protein [Noviherbaspirillum saxi]|nr:hypothetical protein [Noviherbaspirillum saxi]
MRNSALLSKPGKWLGSKVLGKTATPLHFPSPEGIVKKLILNASNLAAKT